MTKWRFPISHISVLSTDSWKYRVKKIAPNIVHIHGTLVDKKNAIEFFIQIDHMRKQLIQNLLIFTKLG